MLYMLLRWISRFTLGIFFQEVELVGLENVPSTGPVIFTGNHQNQFVDGLMLMSYTNRRLGFLIAKKSYDKPLIGGFAKASGAIPVVRRQDVAVSGTGKIKFVVETGPKGEELYFVIGEGTKFGEEMEPGAQVSIPKHEATPTVKRVDSDTRALVNCGLDIGQPAVAFKVLPILDQNDVFETVYDTLKQGKCIAIFPEGGSHDRTELLPLKAGVSLMALGALEKFGVTTTIIPCGLTYFGGHRFRSRAMLEFGPPLVVTPDMLEAYKANRKAASSSLLRQVENRLRQVVTTVPDYESLRIFRACRRLYQPYGVTLPADQYLELQRRLQKGFEEWKDEEKVKQLFTEVGEYLKDLDVVGLNDVQVQTLDFSMGFPLVIFLKRIGYLILLSIAAAPGVILHLPAATYIKQRALAESKKAKASSNVKIAGKDVIASQKIVNALIAIPLLYVLYFSMGVLLGGWRVGLAVLVCLPLLAFICTKATERLLLIVMAVRPLLLLWTFPKYRQQCESLADKRRLLQLKVRTLVETYGPQTFGEEWKKRIIPLEEMENEGSVGKRSTGQGSLLWPRKDSFIHEDISSDAAVTKGLDEEFGF